MSDSTPDKQPKSQSSSCGGPPKPPKKTARGLEDGSSGGKPSFGAEYIDLSNVHFTPEVLRCIPAEMARKHRILPVFKNEVLVGVVFANPGDLIAIDELTHFLNQVVEVLITDENQLNSFIERFYGNED